MSHQAEVYWLDFTSRLVEYDVNDPEYQIRFNPLNEKKIIEKVNQLGKAYLALFEVTKCSPMRHQDDPADIRGEPRDFRYSTEELMEHYSMEANCA